MAKLIKGVNDLSTTNPEIAIQWHPVLWVFFMGEFCVQNIPQTPSMKATKDFNLNIVYTNPQYSFCKFYLEKIKHMLYI